MQTPRQEFKRVWDFHQNPGAEGIGQVPSTSPGRPALMDEAFQEQYRGIISSVLDDSLTLTRNHYKSKLDALKRGLKQIYSNY